MEIADKAITIPLSTKGDTLLSHFTTCVQKQMDTGEIAVRFVVTESDETGYHSEVATLVEDSNSFQPPSIFQFRRRAFENTSNFNVALIIPTGIGCEIGGHAGDATPVARLFASICDNLIIHPNVVNASDINELTENSLYVEGSVLTRLLMGTLGLQKVRGNRVLFVVEEHELSSVTDDAINALSAARATLGLNCPEVLRWKKPWTSTFEYTASGRASGHIKQLETLVAALIECQDQYDAVAICSLIKGASNLPNLARDYYTTDCVNPWGGVEAMLTHTLSMLLEVPTAHSPMFTSPDMLLDVDMGIVDPRKAAEAVSYTYLHSIFKGLHRSPKLISDADLMQRNGVISAEDISCVVIPEGCLGLPTLAALEQGIPIIAVRENKNLMKNNLAALPFRAGQYFCVENYLEAAGLLSALKAGVDPSAIRRPFINTKVSDYQS